MFADKVLTPVWGWCVSKSLRSVSPAVDKEAHSFCRVRNLHAHTFHDMKDGAMFGPKVCRSSTATLVVLDTLLQDCNSIDILHHMDNAGYAYIPEERCD